MSTDLEIFDTEFEVLEETCDSVKIINYAMLICQTLPIVLICILPFIIIQVFPGIILFLAFIISIILSWVLYCIIAVKYIIKAMIYSEERSVLLDFSTRKRLLIKAGFFSKVFYISRKDKKEIEKLLSDPTYKRNSVEFRIRTSLTYLLLFLFGSIFVILFNQNPENKGQKIKYWATIGFAFLCLIYSLRGLLNRQTLLTLLPQGIKLPEKNLITFDKIKDFKIVKKGSGRSSTKYITFQHLSSYMGNDTIITEELSFQNCNISVKKLNYHYDLNLKNYNANK